MPKTKPTRKRVKVKDVPSLKRNLSRTDMKNVRGGLTKVGAGTLAAVKKSQVSVGDVNGDGRADVITASTFGRG